MSELSSSLTFENVEWKRQKEQVQQWSQTELKIMNIALKGMRTMKKNRENLPELDDQGRPFCGAVN